MGDNWPSYETRKAFILLAWTLAAIATVLVEIPLSLCFPAFPLGLVESVTGGIVGAPRTGSIVYTDRVVFGLVVVAWLAYLGLTLGALFIRKWYMSIAFYIVLCWLLIMNVQGCHVVLKHMN